jgi:hypothetical protein
VRLDARSRATQRHKTRHSQPTISHMLFPGALYEIHRRFCATGTVLGLRAAVHVA